MKSKIIIAAVMLAILGSFAFVTIEKVDLSTENTINVDVNKPVNGIIQEDSNF